MRSSYNFPWGRRMVLVGGTLFLLAGGWGLSTGRQNAASAQEQEQERPANTLNPQEISALSQDIADIDALQVLSKLNLKAEQLDAMIEVIAQADADYKLQETQWSVPVLKSLAEAIRENKRRGLTTKDFKPDKECLDGIKFLQKRREDIHNQALAKLAPKLRAILTPEQLKGAVTIAKELTLSANKNASDRGSDTQWFNLYVRQVIMGYSPRITGLLREMKAAHEAKEQG